MIYVRKPTTEEDHELRRMTRQDIGRVAIRAQMILLSAQGRSVPDIARLFEVDRKTVRFWMRRFDQHGPNGLYDEPRSGRPRLVTEAVRDKLVELVQQDPAEPGPAPARHADQDGSAEGRQAVDYRPSGHRSGPGRCRTVRR